MNCKECLPLLPGYLDDELSESQSSALRQHLMDCRACRKVLSSETSLKRWFAFEDTLGVEPPVGFAERVARRAFAGDTGEELVPAPAGAARLVAIPEAGGESNDLQQFVLRATAAAAVLLLVLSAWMHQVHLPDGDHMTATNPDVTVEELLEQADQLHAAEELDGVEGADSGARHSGEGSSGAESSGGDQP